MKIKFLILLLSVFLSILLGFCSISYCGSYEMNEITVKVSIDKVIDGLVEQFNLNTLKPFRVGASSVYKNFDEFKNEALTGDFNAFYFAYFFNGNGNSYYSYMVNGIDASNYTVSSYMTSSFRLRANSVQVSNLSDNSTGNWSVFSQTTNVGASSNNNNYDYYVLLYDHQGKWFEYSSTSFSASYISDLKFVPNQYNGSITLQVSGESVEFMRLNFNRSIGSSGINLGYFTGFENYDINCTSGPYLYNFVYSRTLGNTTYYCKNGTINSNNALYLVKNGNRLNLYINVQYYLYEQGYHVLINIKSRDQDDSSYLYFDSLDFACLPLGDNKTSGDFLINPDINGNYDLGYIYNLNGYFGSNPEVTNNNVNYTLTNLFPSGESGDFFGLSFIDRDNWGFGQLVLWVYDGFINLLTNFDNVTINFGILGDISSSSFTINNNTILTFLSLFTNSFCIILVVFWYYKLIRSISTLNLSAVSSFSFDNNFKMF